MARIELRNGQTYYTIRSAINSNFEELYNMGGSAGQDGQDGKDGVDGKDGSKWLNGSGEPSSELEAVDGDYYIDNDTGEYYEKQSGAWVLIGCLGASGGSGGSGEQIDTSNMVKKFNADDVELTDLADASRGDIATRIVYEETKGAIKDVTVGLHTYQLEDGTKFIFTNITRWLTVGSKHFVLGDYKTIQDDGTVIESKTSSLLVSADGETFRFIYSLYGSSGCGYIAYVKGVVLLGYYGNEIYTVDVETMTRSTSKLSTGMSYNDYFNNAFELGDQVIISGSKTNRKTSDLVTFEEVTRVNEWQAVHYVSDDEVYVVTQQTPTGGSSSVNGVFKTDINFSTWTLIKERSLGSSSYKLARSQITQVGDYVYVLINTNQNTSYVLWFNRTNTAEQGDLTSDIGTLVGYNNQYIGSWFLDGDELVFMSKYGNNYSFIRMDTIARTFKNTQIDMSSLDIASSSLFNSPKCAVAVTDEYIQTNTNVVGLCERDSETVFSGREAYILIGNDPEDIDSWIKIAG